MTRKRTNLGQERDPDNTGAPQRRGRRPLHPLAHSPDEMDRLMQEARGMGLLHGKLGRLLFGNYEGYQEQVWLQCGANATILAIIIGVISVLLQLPQIISFILIGAGCLIALAFCVRVVARLSMGRLLVRLHVRRWRRTGGRHAAGANRRRARSAESGDQRQS